MSVSEGFKSKLECARDWRSHANPSGELAVVLDKALDLLLEKLNRQRFAQTRTPRPARKAAQNDTTRRPHVTPKPEPTREPEPTHKLEATRKSEPIHEASDAQEAAAARSTQREHIPNEVRRAVASRDGGRCTYVD